ncbi:hypothetical protein PAXRUDRAFT_18520 [Paxillus rubicundulus Ve08.2h10]|uniref:Uncharacterized protein n=1 Tax=Paxillus rubicundulus Ve08.2h10 TaxID=930991 RepID=A0A0D0CXU5_9AGAM|nr:hypothetical protein PAXRUDRAFT_18520 [Paxillus rubicundulus Ve08.2h10]
MGEQGKAKEDDDAPQSTSFNREQDDSKPSDGTALNPSPEAGDKTHQPPAKPPDAKRQTPPEHANSTV